jgi:predicted nucleic acid-binding protein
MSVDCFLDTNILVYAVSGDVSDEYRQRVSRGLLARNGSAISAQVMQEFYSVTTTKRRPPLSHEAAISFLALADEIPTVPLDSSLVLEGAENSQRYQISYWDGAIIAAAERLGANVLYTEDLNHGQKYGSVTAINPFRTE